MYKIHPEGHGAEETFEWQRAADVVFDNNVRKGKQHKWDDKVLNSSIEPITLTAACKRLGHWLDIWYKNPDKAVAIIENSQCDDALFPLCGLFEPDEEDNEQPDLEDDDLHRASTASAAVGPILGKEQTVMAPLPKLLKEMEHTSEIHHVQDMETKRNYHRAQVLGRGELESKLRVKWHGYDTKQIHDVIKDKCIMEWLEKEFKNSPVQFVSEDANVRRAKSVDTHAKVVKALENRNLDSVKNLLDQATREEGDTARIGKVLTDWEDLSKKLDEASEAVISAKFDDPNDKLQQHFATREKELCEVDRDAVYQAERDCTDVLGVLTATDWRQWVCIVIAYCTVIVIPEVAMLQWRDLCAGTQNRITAYLCEDDGWGLEGSLCDSIFGIFMGVVGIVVPLVLFPLSKLCYLVLHFCCPGPAKTLRKGFVNLIMDPLQIELLPCVHDNNFQRSLILLLTSLYVSGFCVAAVTMSPGVLSFAHICVFAISRISNVLVGEPVGIRPLRQQRIFLKMEQHRRKNHILMSTEDLRFELLEFLSTTPNSGIVKVSLPFLAVMAHAIYIDECHDSVRMGKFIVRKAYAEYVHPRKDMASQTHRSDVIVDVFANTCQVPNYSLSNSRWHIEKKCLFPWHLSVVLWKVPEIEMLLRLHSLKPGVGCFGWRSTRNGLWAAREAEDIEEFRGKAAEHALEQEGINIALPMMIKDSSVYNVDQVKSLLQANADANFNYVGETALFIAARTGKMSIAKELVNHGANVKLKCQRHDDKLASELFKKSSDKTEFLDFVDRARNNLSDDPLPKNPEILYFPVITSGDESDGVRVEKFPDCLGPFTLARTKKISPEHIKRVPSTEGECRWQADSPTIAALLGNIAHLSMGPLSRVTLPAKERQSAGIPWRATHFAWCNPVRDSSFAQVRCLLTGTADPDFCFIAVGGFVYFTEESEGVFYPLRINALLPVGSARHERNRVLSFGAPRKYHTAQLFFDEMNVGTMRFDNITIPALKAAGYSKFCWVRPEEDKQHGGFAYMSESYIRFCSSVPVLSRAFRLRSSPLRIETSLASPSQADDGPTNITLNPSVGASTAHSGSPLLVVSEERSAALAEAAELVRRSAPPPPPPPPPPDPPSPAGAPPSFEQELEKPSDPANITLQQTTDAATPLVSNFPPDVGRGGGGLTSVPVNATRPEPSSREQELLLPLPAPPLPPPPLSQ